MPDSKRSPQTLYAAVILAALVAVIVLARGQQREPVSPSVRAVPKFSGAPHSHLHEPLPLVMPERVSPISAATAGSEVPAGYPEDESDDLGPITQEEASIYSRAAEPPQAHAPAMRRLAPVEVDAKTAIDSPLPKATSITTTQPRSAVDTSLPVLQAAQLNRRAESLGRRGAYYLARNLSIQSLRMIAESLDLQAGNGEHTAALASALTALREAEDFQSRSNEDPAANVPMLVAGHRTPILRQAHIEQISPITARQQYLNFAQQQLVIAAGGQPVASYGFYLLGKLQLRLQASDPRQTDLARAMVYQQAALNVDGRNYFAANELGSILATFGQLPEARRVLQHSVATIANPDGWHRLADVHDRLGETDLAVHARQQEGILTGAVGQQKVEWVTPEAFAGKPPAASVKPVAGSTAQPALWTADSQPQHMR